MKKLLKLILLCFITINTLFVYVRSEENKVLLDGVEYNNLNEALNNVNENSEIKLLSDISLTESIKIGNGKKFTINLDSYSIYSDLEDSTFNLFGDTHLTIANGTVNGNNKSRFVDVEGNGTKLNIDNISFNNFGNDSIDGGVILLRLNSDVEINNSNFKNNVGNYGGAICSRNANLTVNNSTFTDNTSSLMGSCISLMDDTKFSINGSKFENNRGRAGTIYIASRSEGEINNSSVSKGQALTRGAGIYYQYGGNLTINNCEIFENTNIDGGSSGSKRGAGIAIYSGSSTYDKQINITNNHIHDNTSNNKGGGIFISTTDSNYKTIINLDGNRIVNNMSEYRGGGISLENTKNTTVYIGSGLIEGNKANWGGGIDKSVEQDLGYLVLTNVLITDNKAESGGGIWLCPSSNGEIHSTIGGLIYNNTATVMGDDITYEGEDSESYRPYTTYGRISVEDKLLGGYEASWYNDSEDNRYKEGDEKLDKSIYTDTNQSFFMHAEASEEAISGASGFAKLIIRNNTAEKNGGGLTSNSPLLIGMNNEVELEIKKKWENSNNEIIDAPVNEVKAIVYKVDKDGNKEYLQEVTLSNENNWTVNLNGLSGEYTYEIEEEKVNGFSSEVLIGTPSSSKYEAVIVNKENKVGSLLIKKSVYSENPEDLNKEFTFTVYLKDENDNDLSDYYDYVGSKEGRIKSGETIALKNEESIEILNLPKGTKYNVVEENIECNVVFDGTSGEIRGENKESARFINEYLQAIKESFIFEKNLIGGNISDYTFNFVLKDEAKNEMFRTINNGNEIKFPEIEFSEEGTYRYYVSEINDGNEDIIYDDEEFEIEVIVKREGLSLQATVNYPQGEPIFENEIIKKGKLVVRKTVISEKKIDENKEYEFEILFLDKNNNEYNRIFEYSIDGNNGQIKNHDHFKLKNNQSMEIYGINEGVHYIINEITSADKVEVDNNDSFIIGEVDNTVEFKNYYDEKEKFKIEIVKENTFGYFIHGALLQINQDNETNVVSEWKTDEGYTIELEPGTYIFEEKEAPFGFAKVPNITFEVSDSGELKVIEGEEYSYTLNNTLRIKDERDLLGAKQTLIYKVDEEGNPISGAKLIILDHNNNVHDEWISDNNPHTIELLPGEYTIKELEAPKDYLAINDFKIKVDDNGSISIIDSNNNILSSNSSSLTITDKKEKQEEPKKEEEKKEEEPIIIPDKKDEEKKEEDKPVIIPDKKEEPRKEETKKPVVVNTGVK